MSLAQFSYSYILLITQNGSTAGETSMFNGAWQQSSVTGSDRRMVPLPLVKLVGLAVKQFVSKPVASLLKSQVKTRPFLKNRICIPLGRFYHNFKERFSPTVKGSLKSRRRRAIPRIEDEAAMELGAELIGEVSIYVIAVLVLISEGIKWSNKASEKSIAGIAAAERAAQLQSEHDQLLVDVGRLKEDLDRLKEELKDDLDRFRGDQPEGEGDRLKGDQREGEGDHLKGDVDQLKGEVVRLKGEVARLKDQLRETGNRPKCKF